jgi:hypothetical protein
VPKRKGARRKLQIEWYGDDFLQIVREHGDEALFEAGQIVQAAAERRAPRKTGKLRGSGYVSTASRSTYQRRKSWRKEKKPPVNGATVGFSAPHAHLIESGRRKSGRFGPKRVRRGEPKKALKIGDRYVARSRFKRVSSQPFLGPALEETRTTMVEELASTYRGWLERLLPGKRGFGR